MPSGRCIIFALHTPYWMPSSGSARVAPTKRSGSARTSATVQPRMLLGIEWQDHGRKQDATALPFDRSARGLWRHAGLRDDAFGLLGNELLVCLGAVGCESVCFLGAQLAQLRPARRCGAAGMRPTCRARRRRSRWADGSPHPERAADRGPARLRTPGVPARPPCGRRCCGRAADRRHRPSSSRSRAASTGRAVVRRNRSASAPSVTRT